MAMNVTKQRRIDKLYKIKYKALKELEKGIPHKDVAQMFKVPKNTLSSWKKNKEEIYKSYESGLGATRIKPEKYEALNKALTKWLLIMRSENIPINGPMLKEKAHEFAGELNLESVHAYEGWPEKSTKLFLHDIDIFFLRKK